ncbi:Bug family tripartite tricarboxylate transporter substrate binding protein [Muricoccus radiodurans]|uniref:Bug family tripartite tricarboxylate transporter substrate binding protein n=1 Tax=Muricoccus radiodurans TaxID=2231721 RepID=UPI003CEEDDE0
MTSRIARRGLLCAALAGTAAHGALAQQEAAGYPTRPIRIIVPFPPGVITDAAPRLVAEKLHQEWGQPVVVENRAGANGMIGTEAVVRAPADGYSLGVALADTWSINPRLNPNIGYDPQRELVGVAPLAIQSFALIVHSGVPARSFDEFLALARARPGGLRLGSWGEGSTGHLAMLMLQRATGIVLTHVAYRGAAAAASDVAAGHIDAMITSIATSVNLQRDGRVRALAVTGTERHPALPDTPAIAERYPEVVVRAWYAIVAPARTPAPIVERLNGAIGRAMQAPDVAARITEGFLAAPMVQPVAAFAEFLREDAARWAGVIAASGIRLE